MEHRIDAPDRPDMLFSWAEEFARLHYSQLHQLLEQGYDINIYIAVFSNVLTLGFSIPPTPAIRNLGIPIGLELFSR